MTGELEFLRRAWLVAGSHPEYHRAMQAKLMMTWPVLAKAIISVVESLPELATPLTPQIVEVLGSSIEQELPFDVVADPMKPETVDVPHDVS